MIFVSLCVLTRPAPSPPPKIKSKLTIVPDNIGRADEKQVKAAVKAAGEAIKKAVATGEIATIGDDGEIAVGSAVAIDEAENVSAPEDSDVEQLEEEEEDEETEEDEEEEDEEEDEDEDEDEEEDDEEDEEAEWRVEGHEWLGRTLQRTAYGPDGTTIVGTVNALVIGWLGVDEADFISPATGKPAALWRVRYTSGKVKGDVEDLEEDDMRSSTFTKAAKQQLPKATVSAKSTDKALSVGTTIELLWPDDGIWYGATITAEAKGGKHRVRYHEDDTVEVLNLAKQKKGTWRIAKVTTNVAKAAKAAKAPAAAKPAASGSDDDTAGKKRGREAAATSSSKRRAMRSPPAPLATSGKTLPRALQQLADFNGSGNSDPFANQAIGANRCSPVSTKANASSADQGDALVGASVRKKFAGYGEFDGVIAKKVGAEQYEVEWSDGSETRMKRSALEKIMTGARAEEAIAVDDAEAGVDSVAAGAGEDEDECDDDVVVFAPKISKGKAKGKAKGKGKATAKAKGKGKGRATAAVPTLRKKKKVAAAATAKAQKTQKAQKAMIGNDNNSGLSIYCYHGPSRKKCAALLATHDVVITTYSIAATEYGTAIKDADKHAETLHSGPWTCEYRKENQAATRKLGPGAPPMLGPPCGHKNVAGSPNCGHCHQWRSRADIAKKLLEGAFRPSLEGVNWHRVVLDESHYIRNADAKQTKAVLRLGATNRWCVSGTPFAMAASDLQPQMQFIGCPSVGSRATWTELDKQLLTLSSSSDASAVTNISKDHLLHTLRSSLRALMMRHRMAQERGTPPKALLALPPKIEENGALKSRQLGQNLLPQTPPRELTHPLTPARARVSDPLLCCCCSTAVEVKFSPAEKAVYMSIHKAARARFLAIKARGQLLQKRMVVTALLMPLRQACSGGASMKQCEQAGANYLGQLVDLTGDGKGKSSGSATVGGSDAECTICMDMIERKTVTPCGHAFCKDCITTVLGSSGMSGNRCPICRAQCTIAQLAAAPAPAPAPAAAAAAAATGEVEMASKCKVLLAKLKEVRDEDPSAKSLVFSHFQATIDWLKGKLTAAGYSYRTLAGNMTLSQRTKALQDFQQDPPTTVFLLSIRSGACGINLTQVRARVADARALASQC